MPYDANLTMISLQFCGFYTSKSEILSYLHPYGVNLAVINIMKKSSILSYPHPYDANIIVIAIQS